MIKLLGIGIILVAGTLIGVDFANRFKKRVKEIKGLKLAVETIRNEMSFNFKPLDEVLRKANLKFGSLKKIDGDKVREFIDSLGKSDIATQERQIDFFQRELTHMEEIAVDEANKYSKLAVTLGVSIAAVVAIIVW